MRRLVLIVCAASLAAPAGASAAGLPRLERAPSGRVERPALDTVPRDVLLPGSPAARAVAARVARARFTEYRVAAGPRFRVSVARDANPPGGVQGYLDSVFAWMSRPGSWGGEAGALRIQIETFDGVQSSCNADGAVYACYSPAASTMIIPDEIPASQSGETDFPLPYIVAHEYAHHIASRRSNAPWNAGTWGPKHWATAEDVCWETRRGYAVPGAENAQDYPYNPGENWAEAFAMRLYPSYLTTPGLGWVFARRFRPNAASFGAIRLDVQAPWRAARRTTVRWRIGPGRAQTRLIRLRTPLDGEATIRLQGVKGARFRLQAFLSHQPTNTKVSRGGSVLACGDRLTEFKVRRLAGTGTVRIRLSRP